VYTFCKNFVKTEEKRGKEENAAYLRRRTRKLRTRLIRAADTGPGMANGEGVNAFGALWEVVNAAGMSR